MATTIYLVMMVFHDNTTSPLYAFYDLNEAERQLRQLLTEPTYDGFIKSYCINPITIY